jgi:NADP-dependent 3-hydroxy acid dehydrogenase YdfG
MALDEKIVVITGVSSGIGWGTVKYLTEHGFYVFGSVKDQQKADVCQREFGRNFAPLIFDVRDMQAIEAAAEIVSFDSEFKSDLRRHLFLQESTVIILLR